MSSERFEEELPVRHPESLARTLLLAAAQILEAGGELEEISFLWLRSRLTSSHPHTPETHVQEDRHR